MPVNPSKTEIALGTVCSVSLFDQGNESVYDNIFSRIREIENLMSVNIPASDVSRINAAAGIEPVAVHEDTFKVIERAVFFAELSGGAFDPTVGPLVSLWGIGTENQRVPSQKEIEQTLPLINWRGIKLDANTNSVFLKDKGMALDLGAIAKGYAADEAAKIIKRAGIKRAIIDLGGNIFVLGEKADKSLWKVGIQNPDKNRGELIGYLQITEKTVVTSGVYERFFEENGNRYHHIFNPSYGYPAESGLLSVTLITGVSMDADALSTAVFVLGYDKGMELINSLPETKVIFVFEDRTITTSSGADFTLTDKTYSFLQ
ncbi:MAG: FAD:protein FMN transferase [Treponema sp.]|nr:FAD:protein FMN transferase [Treponema sp.]